LLGPLLAGAGSQWISGHALLFLMAAGAGVGGIDPAARSL